MTARAGPWERPRDTTVNMEMVCLPCPPCPELVSVTCLGAHEVSAAAASVKFMVNKCYLLFSRCWEVFYAELICNILQARRAIFMGTRRQGQGGALAPWKWCKVFCALAVTAKTCILRSSTFFRKKYIPWKKSCGCPWLYLNYVV